MLWRRRGVPTADFCTYLTCDPAHTEGFMAAGRRAEACDSIKSGAKIIALTVDKIIKEEHRSVISE